MILGKSYHLSKSLLIYVTDEDSDGSREVFLFINVQVLTPGQRMRSVRNSCCHSVWKRYLIIFKDLGIIRLVLNSSAFDFLISTMNIAKKKTVHKCTLHGQIKQ